MRICKDHWQTCRDAIEAAGLSSLVNKNPEGAHEHMMAELEGTPPEKNFDPLMSMNWHWSGIALKAGGLSMMGRTPDGSNEGHYCPLCELASHYLDTFKVADEVKTVADQMAVWARSQSLIPALS